MRLPRQSLTTDEVKAYVKQCAVPSSDGGCSSVDPSNAWRSSLWAAVKPAPLTCVLHCLAAASPMFTRQGRILEVAPPVFSTHVVATSRAISAGISGIPSEHRLQKGRFARSMRELSRVCTRPESRLYHVALAVLHPLSARRAHRVLQALLRGRPCSAVVMVIIGVDTLAGSRVRRAALGMKRKGGHQGWDEVVRMSQQSKSTNAHMSEWSILVRSPDAVLKRDQETGGNIYCRIQQGLRPILSLQRETAKCHQCCVFQRSLDDFSCTDFIASPQEATCVSRFRGILACIGGSQHALNGLDWLTVREEMKTSLLRARDGDHRAMGGKILGRLHRLIFEARHGGFHLDMQHVGWEDVFREIFANHLIKGRPGCLAGHTALQLFVLFFVDRRSQGLWEWEAEVVKNSGDPSVGSNESVAKLEPLCFSDVSRWGGLDVLSTRLHLVHAVRWMHFMDSGWPLFKMLSLLTYDECVKNRRTCVARCPRNSMFHVAWLLEDRVVNQYYSVKAVGEGTLIKLARDVWARDSPEVQEAARLCGELFVALAGASNAVAEARRGRMYEASIYVTLTELHLADLSARSACSFDAMVRTPQLWEIMGYIEDAFQESAPVGFGKPCHLAFCPDGGSPDVTDCTCKHLYSSTTDDKKGAFQPDRMCIISADAGGDRPLEGNVSIHVTRRDTDVPYYWSLTHHLNRLYARLHGYRFRRPELSDEDVDWILQDGLSPRRRIQWSIVRLVQMEMEDTTCDYVAWLDSDAYFVTSEPLEALLVWAGMANATQPNAESGASSRLFLFAPAVATLASSSEEMERTRLNISDHFMVVRNTPAARQIMSHWWQLPLQEDSVLRFREHLFLEQTVMNELFPRYPARVAPTPALNDFEGFGGRFVRHGAGIKDQAFVLSLRDALLARVMAPETHPKSAWAAALARDPVAVEMLAQAKVARTAV